MTTLSKEDVVRIMEKSGFNSWVSGEGKSNEEFCMELATIARADLVAENDRLNGYIKTVDNLRAISVDAANKAWIEIDQLRTALAAAEADNERLREVIFSAQTTFDAYVSIHNAKNPPNLEKVSFNQSRSDMCSEAIAQPRDDSALREMIAGVYEECANVPQQIAEALAATHGYDDMGSLSFGRGDHAEEKLGRYNELMEIYDAIRALAAAEVRHGN